LILRALSADCTAARLTLRKRASSNSCVPNASTTRCDCRSCISTATISAWISRTCFVAFFTALLIRETNQSRKGAAKAATSANSKFSQNIRTSMPSTDNVSTRIARVPDDAKSWMVSISVVSVLKDALV